jgi:arginase
LQTQIIQVPYDSGRKEFGMGAGPAQLLKHMLDPLPEGCVDRIEVERQPFELGTTLRVLHALSEKVAAAVQSDRFPLVLSGNCVSCVGTLAGLGAEPSAVVWLDAHADFNTPETTVSGFFDGMALATATGRCWQNLASTVPGFQPVPERNVVLIGARDLDHEERQMLEESSVKWIPVATVREHGVETALRSVLEDLRAERIYLHIDLDVLDLKQARVNRFSSTGGLTVMELVQVVRTVACARPVAAAAISAYDPCCDEDGRALRAGTVLIRQLSSINQDSFARACG